MKLCWMNCLIGLNKKNPLRLTLGVINLNQTIMKLQM
jgi:hypothetical protein